MLYLKDFPCNVLLTALTLDAKHGVVVHFTVGDPVPVRMTQDKQAGQRQAQASRLNINLNNSINEVL